MVEHAARGVGRAHGRGRRLAAAGALVAVALAALLVAWALLWRGGGAAAPGATGASPIAPVALSVSGLRTLARVVPQPIYWAGPRRGALYELRRTSNGDVYVRYLPRGTPAGAPGGRYLVVATYPYRGAFAALRAVAGGRAIRLAGGGIALAAGTSVHLAWPGVAYQVEVYDPSPARARAAARAAEPVR
jgi:hypothetical protein